jgi:hypothetical protein
MSVTTIDRTVQHLRDTHRSLRAERLRVAQWRRLVRARMELAASAVAMPEPLGDVVGHGVPAAAHADLPLLLGLAEAVSAGGPEGEIDRLESLRALDRRLAAYESTVARALRDLADELLERVLADAVPVPVGARPTPPIAMGHTVTWT